MNRVSGFNLRAEKRDFKTQDVGDGECKVARATTRQLASIWLLASRKAGWTEKELNRFIREMFGKSLDTLTRREASAVMQHFQESGTAI